MPKKILSLILALVSFSGAWSQIIYSERFNALPALNTGTNNSTGATYLYGDVPANMLTINSGNLVADTTTGNYPFRSNGQKQKAWLAYQINPTLGDTFAVSTSWLKPNGSSDAWIVTPIITNITANTVLTWNAMAPDANNMDGYEVYVTTNTVTTPGTGDFTNANKLFSTNAENYTWTSRGASLSAYVGQNIRIGFRNNSNNKYQLWLDDIVVENISNAFDIETSAHHVYKYSTVNTVNTITATFKNKGYAPAVTSLTINYKIGLNPTVTEVKTLSAPLNYMASTDLGFLQPFISSTASYNDFKIWVSAVNGQPDQVNANDTVYGSLTLSTASPAKKILLEQFTGTRCEWCPDGYTKLSSIVATNTNVVAVSTHTNDNMASAVSDLLIADYATQFPSATIDQYSFSSNLPVAIERNNWSTYITQRMAMKVPASVSLSAVSINTITNQIDATVSTTFVGDVKGDYRLNLYIKENNVYGPVADNTDNGWNQYSALYNIPSSPYYGLGNYLNSTTYLMMPNDYKHQYVIDYMADGAYGAAGIIPSTGGTAGQTYSKTYSYVLPAPSAGEFRFNADNIYLIGVLSEYNADTRKRAILNVEEVKLNANPETLVSVNELAQKELRINLYPNPANGLCFLNYELKEAQTVNISVYNTLGELVYMESHNEGAGNITQTLNTENLNPGTYSIEIAFKNYKVSKKLTVIK